MSQIDKEYQFAVAIWLICLSFAVVTFRWVYAHGGGSVGSVIVDAFVGLAIAGAISFLRFVKSE